MAPPGLVYPEVAVPLSANGGSLFDLESKKQFMLPYPPSFFEVGGAPYMCVIFIKDQEQRELMSVIGLTKRVSLQ